MKHILDLYEENVRSVRQALACIQSIIDLIGQKVNHDRKVGYRMSFLGMKIDLLIHQNHIFVNRKYDF